MPSRRSATSSPGRASRPILEVEGLNVRHALQDINLQIRAGEIVGDHGPAWVQAEPSWRWPSLAMLRHGSGRLTMDGKRVGIKSIQDAIADGIGMCRKTASARACSWSSPSAATWWCAPSTACAAQWASPIPGGSRQAADWVRNATIKTPDVPGARQDAVGRQPAARGAGQVAGEQAEPDDPQRSHRRRRHRRKGTRCYG